MFVVMARVRTMGCRVRGVSLVSLQNSYIWSSKWGNEFVRYWWILFWVLGMVSDEPLDWSRWSVGDGVVMTNMRSVSKIGESFEQDRVPKMWTTREVNLVIQGSRRVVTEIDVGPVIKFFRSLGIFRRESKGVGSVRDRGRGQTNKCHE